MKEGGSPMSRSIKGMRLLLIIALLVASGLPGFGQTITWNGGGDGTSWFDPNNWIGHQVPGPVNVAVITNGIGTVITVNQDAQVQQLQCTKGFSITGGTFTVTTGASLLQGALTLTAGSSLSAVGPAVTLTCTGPTTAEDASFYATGGGVLTLAGLAHWQKTLNSNPVWQASGTGSQLVFPALTTLNAAPFSCCDSFTLQASDGGVVSLTHVQSIDGRGQVTANGSGSLLDLSGMSRTPAYGLIAAQNGGEVRVPQVRTSGSSFYVDAASTLNLSALTSLPGGTLTVAGFALALPGLGNADDASFYVTGGGVLTLAGLAHWQKIFGDSPVWQASGAGSQLVFPALTVVNAVPFNCCDNLTIQASGGGVVSLTQVQSIDGRAQMTANGTSSLLDLSGMSCTPAYGSIAAQNGGEVRVPQVRSAGLSFFVDAASTLNLSMLTSLPGGTLTVAGFALALPGLGNADDASFYVTGGGVLTLAGLAHWQKIFGDSPVWQASGAGSQLVFPALTVVNAVPFNCCDNLTIQASGGGVVSLTQVQSIDGRAQMTANGTSSLLDLSGMSCTPAYGSIAAQNGGEVRVPQVRSAGLSFVVDAASTLSLSMLTSLPCGTLTVPLAKVMLGASFTGTRVMVKVLVARSTPPLAVPPESCTMTVTVAEPLAFAAGVKVRVPPVSAGATLKSEGLSLVTERPLRVCADSFAGPTLKVAKPVTLAAPLSSSTTTLFVAKAMAGASFTGVTVRVKVCGALVSTPLLAVPPLS